MLRGRKNSKKGEEEDSFFSFTKRKYKGGGMYVCIYIPVKISCFHKLQQRSLQFFCTSAAWSMKNMCPNLITQPILCQAYTGLRVTEIFLLQTK